MSHMVMLLKNIWSSQCTLLFFFPISVLLAQLYQRSRLQRGSVDVSLKCTLVLSCRWDSFLEERTFFWLLGNQGDFGGWEFLLGIFLLPRGVKSENVGLVGKRVLSKKRLPLPGIGNSSKELSCLHGLSLDT